MTTMVLQQKLDETVLTSPTQCSGEGRKTQQRQHSAPIPRTTDSSRQPATLQSEWGSLEEVIAHIQQLPKPVANCQPASGLLATHLRESSEVADSSFNVTAWNQAWDVIEVQMKNLERAEQQAEGRSG